MKRLIEGALRMFRLWPDKPSTIDIAIDRARAVGERADRVNETLQPYLEKADPFKAFATDIFNRAQRDRLYRGLLGE